MTAHSFRTSAEAIAPELAALRHALHREPETGLALPLTQAKVLDALAGLPLEITTGKGLSSVTAVLRGGRPDPVVLLRGDMDALPLQELADVPYKSRIDGVMHACGHDQHVAILVGAARLFSARREELSGTVVFMFQPGAEVVVFAPSAPTLPFLGLRPGPRSSNAGGHRPCNRAASLRISGSRPDSAAPGQLVLKPSLCPARVGSAAEVPAAYRLRLLLDTSRTVARGSMPDSPSFHAASLAIASVIARGTGVPAVNVPMAAIPAVRWLKPWACAPVTGRSTPPARPS
jgi:hypothetical protein